MGCGACAVGLLRLESIVSDKGWEAYCLREEYRYDVDWHWGRKRYNWQRLPIIEVELMATMNVSLPDAMKLWVEQQAESGRYSNASDYVRDLIRRDQDRAEKIARIQALVTEGIESGAGSRSMSELRQVARKQASGD